MQLRLTARDLVVVSWQVDPGEAGRPLPEGVEPLVTDTGSAVVSLAAYRNENVRLDGQPVPSFAQANVRTYWTRRASPRSTSFRCE